MAACPQPPFFSSRLPSGNPLTLRFSPPRSCNFPSFKNTRIWSSNSPESTSISDQNSPDSDPNEEQDPIKNAFAKAKAYKTSIKSSAPPPKIIQEPVWGVNPVNGDGSFPDELKDGDVDKEVPLAVKLAFEKAKEYKKGKSGEEAEGAVPNIVQKSGLQAAEIVGQDDELKDGNDGGDKEVPLAVKIALEKAKEYKNNKGNVVSIDGGEVGTAVSASGSQGENKSPATNKKSGKSNNKTSQLSISSIDFMGLNFADKKIGRGLPPGLVPQSDSFPEGDLPDVEILVGDASKFEDAGAATSKAVSIQEDDSEFYKPKVSTWGVFPRPSNISKTFGGGRTLSPGEALESVEEKAIKEARTKQLVAAYNSRIGLRIDPKLKSECEKALKDGDALMDLGKLKEALPFYEKVMEKLAFQNELHGLAALQWSICQDSLSRSKEAREMYDKLQSHPTPAVSKRARQFNFGFQAMEMMKVSSSRPLPLSMEYQNYFDAFIRDKTKYLQTEVQGDEDVLIQAVPYFIFLVSPIIMVLLIAASKFQ